MSDHITGYVREHRRVRASEQIKRLQKAGATHVMVEGKGAADLLAFIRDTRKGDTRMVCKLFLLADPKITPGNKRLEHLQTVITEIEKRGGRIYEVDTGRNLSKRADRDAMIFDACNDIRAGGRYLSAKQAKHMGKKGGRPRKVWPDDVVKRAEAIWFDSRLKTWADAEAKLPDGMTARDANKRFGPRTFK